MAHTLQQIRDWNASLKSKHLELVALFVVGTSGIGKHAAIKLASAIDRPTIYIVGRNEVAGSQVVNELEATNPNGTYAFKPADVSQLRNVDALCHEFECLSKKLDVLFLSSGAIAFSKQVHKLTDRVTDTEANIDVNHMLRYYSRIRFIQNLVPLLESAENPRVISVLAGGKEIDIKEENLDLRKSFSLSASNGYPASMTSLVFEVLASQHPSVSFIHEFPGIVATPLLKNSLGSVLGSVLGFMTKLISISAEESGEWQTFLLTSPIFPAKCSAGLGLPQERKTKIRQASTGELGGGSYILNYNGQDATNELLMSQLREKGFPDIVWKHTLKIFTQASA